MPDQLQLRGGTTTEHNSFTGAAREVTVDTTKKTLVVHDGSQAGGTPLMKESGATAASSVQIGTGGVERLKLTSSEVVFNETSTDTDFRIEGDNQTHMFYVDAGNNRVGIGQSTPTSIFHIKDFNPDVIIENTSGGTGQLRVGHFGNGAFIGTYSDDGGGSDALRLGTHSGDERMRITSDGKIGIGTTNPTANLHVLSSGDTIIRVTSADGSAAFLDLGDASDPDGGRIHYDSGSNLVFNTGSLERMRINSSGNLGIGTTSPRDKLEIKGANGGYSFRINSEAQFVKLLSSDNTGGTQGGFRFSTDNASTEIERMRIDNNGNVGIGTTSPTSKLNVVGRLDVNGNQNQNTCEFFANTTSGQSFGILVNGGTTSGDYCANFRDKDAGNIMILRGDGNVGIGTSTPTNKLEITNTTSDKGILIKTTGDNFHTICGDANRTNANDNILRIDSKWNGTVVNRIRMLAGADTTNKDDGIICFDTASGGSMGESMRIDSNGNVGIGTSSPDAELDLGSSTSGRRITWNSYSNIFSETSSGALWFTSNFYGTGSNTFATGSTGNFGAAGISVNATGGGSNSGLIEFFVNTNASKTAGNTFTPTEVMRIDSAGGLRIGTTGANYDELFTITESGTNNEIATWRVNDASHNKDMLNMIHVANSGSRVMIRFRRTGSLTSIGDITTSATATSYGTNSDYRLKENQALISDGITRLKALKPYRFNFKADPTTTVDGFFAHEVTPVVPEAITGEKDAMAPETWYQEGDTLPSGKSVGDPKTYSSTEIESQTIDQSKLVPLLVAAVQELIGKVEALEAA